MSVRVRVLGPLEVGDDAGALALGPAKQRAVLALLLARHDALVTVDEIIDELWEDAPPRSAAANARMYAANLRRLFAGAPGAPALTKRGTGYVLSVEPARLDLVRFRELVRQGRESKGRGDTAALSRFDEGIGLWRGPAVADVRGGRIIAGWRTALEEERLSALEERCEALLAAGAFDRAAARARELLVAQPLRERAHALLIRACYDGGDTAGALTAYDSARRTLVDQLGIEPGEELRRLQRAILDGAPSSPDGASSSGPAAVIASRPSGPVVPRQLPADVAAFTGRAAYLRRLDALLPARDATGTAAVVISAIAGTAGVGKTALAVHWAHRMAGEFPDGQLYVNLRGFDASGSAMSPADAVRGFLDALEVPPQRIPAGLAAQVGLYRSLLAGKRLLVVLDNARDAEQVRPLLPGSPGCLALVTSRNPLTSLVAAEGAHPVALDLLTVDEARQLLARRLGADRVAAAPDAVEEIIHRCARLPLALAVVAARAAIRPGAELDLVARELRDSGGRLDVIDGGDAATNARAVFSWSYDTLTAEAARLFRLLGLHPGPDVSAPAAASLAGIPVARVRPLLAELVEAHLLGERESGRYAFHDLLRAYAAELSERLDSDAERLAASHRSIDHYLHTGAAAALLLEPRRQPVALGTRQPMVVPEELADHAAALAWFNVEYPVMISLARQAAGAGFDAQAWRLCWVASADFLERRGLWDEQIAAQSIALEGARRVGDQYMQADSHRVLGRALARIGRFDEAHSHYRRVLELAAGFEDIESQAKCHNSMGLMFEYQHRHEEALSHVNQALAKFRAIGNRAGQAYALNSIGVNHAHLGEYERARTCCEDALALHKELGDRYGQAATWDSLGDVHYRIGDHKQAVACYRRSLDLIRQVGERYHEGLVLVNLGDAYHAAGDTEAARLAWREALPILVDLGHADADRVRAKLRDLTPADAG